MTEKKNYESIDGLVGYERGGKPHAVGFVRNLFVNTEPKIKEFGNNKVLEFLTTIQGQYSKDGLERVAKGQLESSDYGVTASLTVDITHPNVEKFRMEQIKKGCRISTGMVDFTINQGKDGKTFLNGSLRGIGFVEKPKESVETVQEAKPAEPQVDNSLGF